MDVIVCKSAAGYYIGTLTEEGWPISRESESYYETKASAEFALKHSTWVQRTHP